MRRTWVLVVVGLASLGAAGAEENSAMATGKITLKMVGGVCKATLTGGDLDVDVRKHASVAWEVTNQDCNTKQSVIVGRTAQAGTHYAVLDCGRGVALPKPGSGTLTCKVDPRCAGLGNELKVYKYAVCVNRKIAIDPDLRVGGGVPRGDCKNDPKPHTKCEDATK